MPLPEAEVPQGHKNPGMGQALTPTPAGHSLLQALLYHFSLEKSSFIQLSVLQANNSCAGKGLAHPEKEI